MPEGGPAPPMGELQRQRGGAKVRYLQIKYQTDSKNGTKATVSTSVRKDSPQWFPPGTSAAGKHPEEESPFGDGD